MKQFSRFMKTRCGRRADRPFVVIKPTANRKRKGVTENIDEMGKTDKSQEQILLPGASAIS